MGKNLQHQNTNISLENGNPGCMYSVFHVLHRHRWHRVKKMLPYKRNSGGKRIPVIADPGDSITPAEACELELQSDSEMSHSPAPTTTVQTEERTSVSSPVTKTSMKARIKAFVTEEMSKRKGRHHRCSSYPERQQLSRTNSIHHLELSEVDLPELASHHDNSSHRSDTENSSTKKRKCDICAAMLTMSYLKQSNNSEHEKQEVKDNAVAEVNIEKSNQDSLEENQGTSAASETKQLLEALDIFDMRKEFCLKILQNPMSPLGEHLHSRQTFNSRKVFTKSVSFPVSASAGRRDPRVKDYKSKQDEEKFQLHGQSHKLTEYDYTEHKEDGSKIPVLTRSASSHELKTRNENKLVMKRFRNLRHKLSHAIKESRKEKHRIRMDAVFHKVPYGRKSSKYAKDYESLDLKDKYRKHSPGSSCGSDQSASEKACLRRTSSYNETLNKYSRLFDGNFNKEARQHISERVKVRQAETPSPSRRDRASLGRILSLPDLRSSVFVIGEDSPCMIHVDTALNVVSKRIDQRASPGVSLAQEHVSQEHVDEVGKTLDEKTEASERAQEIIEPRTEIEKPGPVSVLESSSREDMSDPSEISLLEAEVSVIEQQESLDAQNIEVSVEHHHIDHFLRIPMEIINGNAEFKYVRDVLTLAGFSGNDFLRAWHSAFQPVHTSVYEEVENGLLPDPDLLEGAEESQKNDRLLLFDLINEVLLDVHERSFTYCPKPLTCRSHIHPMPIGYHVLEEVWNKVSWYMRYRPEMDQLLDDAVSRDLTRDDGWMNLQFEAECVGIELEDMIFDDLLDELVYEVDDYV